MNFSLTKISLKKIMIQGWIWVLICNTPNLAADSNGCLPPIGSNIQASCEAPKQGPQGIRGPQGPQGPRGSTGPTGPTGPAASTNIPYASGFPVNLTTNDDGSTNTVAIVSFGNSMSGIALTSGSIDISGGPGINDDHAFSMSTDGVITSIAAYFSGTNSFFVGDSLLFEVIVTAQLYESTVPNNTFTPIPGASVVMAQEGFGFITLPLIFNGITTGLNIPVSAQTRLLMVFSATFIPLDVVHGSLALTLSGYASAGVTIQQ